VTSETLALIAFEVGYCSRHPPEASTIVFWFMMQIGMILGLLTSYPAN
jgi:Domain of unknown function (DUF4396)